MMSTLPSEAIMLYEQHYHSLDPWAAIAQWQPSLKTMLGPELVPQGELLRSEFYNDFGAKFGLYNVVGAMSSLNSDATVILGVSVLRPRVAAPFGETDRRKLTLLLPHIQRAFQIYHQIRHLERKAQTGFAALESLPFGVAVASADGKVVFANSAAERLARSGNGLELGGQGCALGAVTPSEAAALRQMVHDAATGGAGGAMRLTRRISGPSLAVLVSPLPAPYREMADPAARLALVLIKDLADATPAAGKLLCALYGFTPAETQVTMALYAGRSAEEIVAERRVSVATVRAQIRQVLEKTEASNLRDLVRQLAELSVVEPY
jgi:DNA-binding NarL/FixJ family response regulator